MGDKTGIEWTDATWNPTVGCDRVSPGCDHCYAMTMAKRLKAMGQADYQNDGDPRTSGPGFGLTTRPHMLDQPLRWRRPRLIFVNSMSDLFHEKVPDEFIAKVFAVMALASQHTFQVLTKRHGRLRSLLSDATFPELFDLALRDLMMRGVITQEQCAAAPSLPLPNVWLGVSVEDQKWADIRIPALLDTPAAIRFLSCEPLLGPIGRLYLTEAGAAGVCYDIDGGWWHKPGSCPNCRPRVDWVIVGGESGPHARPMNPTWARSIRDSCQDNGVPYLFKQWGDWAPGGSSQPNGTRRAIYSGDQPAHEVERGTAIRAMWTFGGGIMTRRGKHAAGRQLDGRTWDQYPGSAASQKTAATEAVPDAV